MNTNVPNIKDNYLPSGSEGYFPKSRIIDIAWYDGDGHQYQFNILTATNPNEFKDQFSGFSAGNTASPEKYHLNQIDARWVRISITNPSEYPTSGANCRGGRIFHG